MVSPQKDILIDGIRSSLDVKRSPFPEPQQVAWRSSHSLCPHCCSITVRFKDGRDMPYLRLSRITHMIG
jgi:hypothetical protein